MGFLEYKLKGLKYAMSPTIPLYFAVTIGISQATINMPYALFSADLFTVKMDVAHGMTVRAEAGDIAQFDDIITVDYYAEITAEDCDGKQIDLTITVDNPVYCLAVWKNEIEFYSNIQIDERYSVSMAPGWQWNISAVIEVEADGSLVSLIRAGEAAIYDPEITIAFALNAENILLPTAGRFTADIKDYVNIEMGHDLKMPFELGAVNISSDVGVACVLSLYRDATLADYRGKKLSELRGKTLNKLKFIKIK